MIKSSIKYLTIVLGIIVLNSCANSREEAIPVIADFSIDVIDQDFSVPVEIFVTNLSEGGDTFQWTFEGGIPATSSDRNPGTIVYNEAGDFTIRLEVSNQDGSIAVNTAGVPIDAEINIDFDVEILENNFPPVEVVLTNNTVGADMFDWTFENGSPVTSSLENPENIIFNTPGTHTITLEVGNGLETFEQEETITVAPNLNTAFDFEVAFQDDDFQVPVTIDLINQSVSATAFNWTFEGANITTSTDQNPSVTFTEIGTHTITLEASNGKETESVFTTIEVVENTNLRIIENIELGINSAHINNSIGAFFSTITREVYQSDALTDENGALIDIVFFGLNENFSFNRFVSPSAVTNLTTFSAIPNATNTTFINVQENCNCNASLTENEFETMTDDSLLSQLTITAVEDELQDFDNTVVPRIVLFETNDGRRGAIRINNFIANGINSTINIDIKVQKE